MGDRANIIVKSNKSEQVCLYSHWGGSELAKTLKTALVRGHSRWDDSQYLTRIIFCEMIQRDPMGLTGFGLSQTPGDGEDNIIIVDADKQTIKDNDKPELSFSDFTKG